MKIAIDVSPLKTGHRVRGIGFYLKNLKDSLLKYHSENEYIFFTDTKEIPSDADLVHYPYFDPFFVTLPVIPALSRWQAGLPFYKKQKTIVTIHDLTPLVFPAHFPSGIKGKIKWHIQKRNILKSDRIITDSKSSKKDISKFTGIDDKKIDVVYLAAGEEFRPKANDQKLMTKYKLPSKFVLYVGDVTWNKNLPRLIKSLSGTDIPLVMVGKALTDENYDNSNPWNQDLAQTQELITNNDNISALGFVPTEDLVILYNMATAFAMPSIYEGFGLPILEAMQSGCPVITSRGGSLPEVAGDAALYIDADDTKSIRDGIQEVFENTKLQDDLSKKGLEQAKKFSWKNTARDTIKAYELVLRS